MDKSSLLKIKSYKVGVGSFCYLILFLQNLMSILDF
jgi:hypothetical protein